MLQGFMIEDGNERVVMDREEGKMNDFIRQGFGLFLSQRSVLDEINFRSARKSAVLGINGAKIYSF